MAQHRNRSWVLLWWGCPNQERMKIVFEIPWTWLNSQPGCAEPRASRQQSWGRALGRNVLSKTPSCSSEPQLCWKWDGKQPLRCPWGSLTALDFLSHPDPSLLQRQREKMNFFTHQTHDSDELEHWGIRSKESVWSLISILSHTSSTVRKSLQKEFTLLLLVEGDTVEGELLPQVLV